MLPISETQCGGILAMWLEKKSNPDIVKQIVAETGYNDSPFFGANAAKIKIIGNVTILNCAIAIIAVNAVVPKERCKGVIDSFLAAAKKPVFSWIESKDSSFNKKYTEQISDYFKATQSKQMVIGISYSFLENIGKNPLNCLEAQLLLNARISNMISETIDILKSFSFVDCNITTQEQILAFTQNQPSTKPSGGA